MSEQPNADSVLVLALVRLARAAYEQGYRHGRESVERAHIDGSGAVK